MRDGRERCRYQIVRAELAPADVVMLGLQATGSPALPKVLPKVLDVSVSGRDARGHTGSRFAPGDYVELEIDLRPDAARVNPVGVIEEMFAGQQIGLVEAVAGGDYRSAATEILRELRRRGVEVR